MRIREYTKEDETEWLRCRLLSFYDSSYYDDVIHQKNSYDNNMIDLVAIEKDTIVGFIEIEIEKDNGDVCYLDGDLGGNIWNLGVLPEFRKFNVATDLLKEAISRGRELNLTRFEAWTQDDVASNKWYEKNDFKFVESYLNVYATETECKDNKLISDNIGSYYGIRKLNFEVSIDRKDEIYKKFSKVHEVKLYELKF